MPPRHDRRSNRFQGESIRVVCNTVRGACEFIDDVEIVRQVMNHRRGSAESGRRGSLDSAPMTRFNSA